MLLEKKVSFFNSTRETDVKKEIEISQVLSDIKNGTYKRLINQVRNGDEEAKKQLPTVAVHGLFNKFRKKDRFIEASGLIILDLDDVLEDEIEETKQTIMEMEDHVLATMRSPSGNGIKILYYVDPDIITSANYKAIGKEVVSIFDSYGKVDYLSVTDCLIMTYDEHILINEDVYPASVMIRQVEAKKVELEELDTSKALWDDVEDFFDTVLAEDIAQKTTSNFHFIQVSILDLAKFGFYHPAEDLSFVIDYSESYFKASRENKNRFLEAVELSKSYPQQFWPYKTVRDYEEEEPMLDYSSYLEDTIPTKKDKSLKEAKKSEELDDYSFNEVDEDSDGFVDLTNFKERVLEVVKEGDRVGREVSFKNFADVFRFKGTGILTITGIPGHGKTEFTDALLVDLARMYGEQSIMVGFEQSPEEHVIKLIRKMVGTDITCPSWINHEKNMEVFDVAYDFITSNFHHVDTRIVGGNINTLLTKCAEKIKAKRDAGEDIRYVVFDPFNMMSIKGKLSTNEKAEEILRRLTHFSHQMGVMVILIAHPFKMKRDETTGQYQVPDFYSVKGSSAFFEMSYHGLTVYRRDDNLVMVKVLKVKQNNLGEREAEVFFEYQRPSGRYTPITEDIIELAGDHRDTDWLSKIFNKEK